jgi:8-amino-7-oxononanoate synthase
VSLDFTSSLYLGLRHATVSLRPWNQFTIGKPAALEEPPVVARVAGALAALIGCEAGILAGSTLHLAWDLMGLLAHQRIRIYLDEGTYPILRWGMERAAVRGVPLRTFPSHDHRSLGHQLLADSGDGRVPVVVTDGSCPSCGQVAPLSHYLAAVRPYGGFALVDDTQALGILGSSPEVQIPYGTGGGGSLRWHGINGPDLLVIASLAKGFGVPLAVFAGADQVIGGFARMSETRVHCSPPSVATLHAAERTLAVNQAQGDQLRKILADRVSRLRDHLVRLRLSSGSHLFPVQLIQALRGEAVVQLHACLARAGVQTVLMGGASRAGAKLAFIVTARHTDADIDSAAEVLETALAD